MARSVETPAGQLEDGARYDLVLQHGTYTRDNLRSWTERGAAAPFKEGDPVEERVTGTVRIFDQDGEPRYEVVTRPADETVCQQCGGTGVVLAGGQAVGFLPEHVLRMAP